MFNNYYFIKYLSYFLNKELANYKIVEIFSQEKNKLVISFKSNDIFKEQKFLEFNSEKDFTYLVLKRDFKKTKKNYAQLFDYLYNMNVDSVSLFNDDRIITIKLEENFNLHFFFLTGKQNLFIESGGIINDSFKLKDELKNKNVNNLLKKKSDSKSKSELKTIGEYLKLNYYKFGSVIFDEVLHNLNLKKNELITQEKITLIDKAFIDLHNKINNPNFLLYKVDDKFIPSLIHLNYLKRFEFNEYRDINEMLFDYVTIRHKSQAVEEYKERILNSLNNKERLVKNKLESIKKQIEQNKDYQKFLEYGNIILLNKDYIKKGDKIFKLGEVVIPLDEKLTALGNASKYFDKYKKSKSNINILNDKLLETENQLTDIIREKENVLNISDIKIFKKMDKEIVTEKESPELKHFRIFKLDENFEVWVGKNSLANDLLTTKYSSQNDLWFHIRDYSGSHTVLKRKNKRIDIPNNYILYAASIAAYYSKARNAGKVAVAYCERKYVKKRKGFKEGTVIMEREKVIFVKPGIPEKT